MVSRIFYGVLTALTITVSALLALPCFWLSIRKSPSLTANTQANEAIEGRFRQFNEMKIRIQKAMALSTGHDNADGTIF